MHTTRGPYEQFQTTRYFGSLDALRCFAILGVIWQHAPGISPQSVPFTNPGVSGVSLFFGLSGFLITTLLLREEHNTGNINLRHFYARRSLRILPLYYAVLGLYTMLVVAMEDNAAGRLFISNLPYYLTYTNNWFVDLIINADGERRVIFIFAWTLATEEQFYLAWPAMLKFLRRGVAIGMLLCVLITDVALTMAYGELSEPATTTERLLRIATSPSIEICIGVLLALGLNSRSLFAFAWPVLGRWWSSPTAAIAALGTIMLPVEPTLDWRVLQAMILALLLATCVVREDHGLARILRMRVLARMGVVSYGMYLLHMLSINTVERIVAVAGIHLDAVIFVLSLVVTYLAAEVSFRLFESPLLQLKSRFQPSPLRRDHACAAVSAERRLSESSK